LATELERQRPFNTGDLEGQQIRAPSSHPLPSLRRAVEVLGGVPDPFETAVLNGAAAIDTERVILQDVDRGTTAISALIERATSGERANSESQATDAISRLVDKSLLTIDDEEVELS